MDYILLPESYKNKKVSDVFDSDATDSDHRPIRNTIKFTGLRSKGYFKTIGSMLKPLGWRPESQEQYCDEVRTELLRKGDEVPRVGKVFQAIASAGAHTGKGSSSCGIVVGTLPKDDEMVA